MDYTCKTRTLSALMKDMKNNKFSFDSPLQRKENQWNKLQKSELIDSIIRSYPVDPIRAIKLEDGTLDVIDGKQRMTIIRDYIYDLFFLSRSLEPVIIDGTEFEIDGLKFSKLDEAVQDKIKSYEIQVYSFTDCTDKDVREMFRRQNNGTPLKPSQKLTAYQSEELSNVIFELSQHQFFGKVITINQAKRDMDKDIIREVLMLSESSKENPITSFKTKDVSNFILNYSVNEEKVELIKKALDILDDSFEENVKIPKTSLSFVIYSCYRIVKDKKSTSKFIDWLKNDFLVNYENNAEYLAFCQSGTSSAESVRGRLDYWRDKIRTL